MTEMVERATAVELPPLEVQNAEQQIIRALEKAVHDRGYDYTYDDQGGACAYVETERGCRDVGYWTLDDDGIREDYKLAVPMETLQSSCILGAAFLNVGIPIESIVPWNDQGFTEIIDSSSELRELMTKVSPKFRQALKELQNDQDTMIPWGKAFDSFKQKVGA